MSEPKAVFIPQLNPNEIDVRLVHLSIHNRQAIKTGDAIATFETTKSTSELVADGDGYVIGLSLVDGDNARSGDVFFYLGADPDDRPPEKEITYSSHQGQDGISGNGEIPDGLRISKPALTLAQQYHLNLSQLPRGPLVTESQVRALLQTDTNRPYAPAEPSTPKAFDPNAIIIYGGGGHGKALIDMVHGLGNYKLIGLVDDGIAKDTQILGIPVLGGSQILEELASRGIHLAINAVGGIGYIRPRLDVFKKLAEAGFICPAVIHPRAVVETSAILSGGVQVFPFAYIGSSSELGFGVIANTGVIISHDCVIKDYANISPGAILAGGVTIGERSLVGMGVTINLGVSIGADARIGNSATIKADVPTGTIVHAGSIWPPIA